MPTNLFDKACRFAAKMDPMGFLCWLLRLSPKAFRFRGWLDTRGIPFPREPDRTCDTVARLERSSGDRSPWAVTIEFQIRPDAAIPGRLLSYLSSVWLDVRPDDERDSRYNVGAAVVNLTGTGTASREMQWSKAGLRTHLGVVERNLEEESAEELLSGIETGKWSRCLLVWVPLMMGGGDTALVDRWIALAETEPDVRRKSEYAFIALLFAEKVGRNDLWQEKLKGWNVEESVFVNKLIAQGEARGRLVEARSFVLRFGAKRFGQAPEAVASAVHAISDRERLERIADRIPEVANWDDLLTTP